MRIQMAIVLALAACSESAPEITTTDLPNGEKNVLYTAFLESSGGEAPLRWALAEGSTLPDGLTLNPAGAISGVPTRDGASTFDVIVEDALGQTDEGTFELDIEYRADVLLCDGVVEGRLPVASIVSFALDPTIVEGLAWISVALPEEDVTRIDVELDFDANAVGFLYFGLPGTEPGDTELTHYTPRTLILQNGVRQIDAGTRADLAAYRERGEPITLMLGADAPIGWSFEAKCSTGPIFQRLVHNPTRVGEAVDVDYDLIGQDNPVRIWTEDPLPDWLTWDETTGQLGGVAEQAGVWPITINALDAGGEFRQEQSWISTWEPTPVACGETVDVSSEEGYYSGDLGGFDDPRGYAVFEVSPPTSTSKVTAQLEGPTYSYIGWSRPSFPIFSSDAEEVTDGVAVTYYSPDNWPPIGDALARGLPLTGTAYNVRSASDMRISITCDNSPRPDLGILPVLNDSDRFELPAIGGTGALTWEAFDLPSGVALSNEGVLTSSAPTPGRYEVSIAVEDETGQRSETPFSLDVGWDAACEGHQQMSCGQTLTGTLSETVFTDTEGAEKMLCLVHEVEQGGRAAITITSDEGAYINAILLNPSGDAVALGAAVTDQQSSVLAVGGEGEDPIDPWLDRIMPLQLRAFAAGDWTVELQCE